MRQSLASFAGLAIAVIVTVAEQPVFKLGVDAAEAQPMHQMTGEDLHYRCTASSGVRVRCDAVIATAAAAYSSPLVGGPAGLLCVPYGEDIKRLRAAFLRYTAAHPEALSAPATVVIGQALRAGHACPPGSWQAQG
jgi:hypothetical protein